MEYPCSLMMRHLFNGDAKGDKMGPLLVIECHVKSAEEMGIGHYFIGSGTLKRKEINILERHWKKNGFLFLSQYIRDRL